MSYIDQQICRAEIENWEYKLNIFRSMHDRLGITLAETQIKKLTSLINKDAEMQLCQG